MMGMENVIGSRIKQGMVGCVEIITRNIMKDGHVDPAKKVKLKFKITKLESELPLK